MNVKNYLNVLTISKIRQITNKPYRAYGLSISEFSFVVNLSLYTILGVVFLDGIIQSIFFRMEGVYYVIPVIIFLGIYITKKIQKTLGEGLIFFILADLKNSNIKMLDMFNKNVYSNNKEINIKTAKK